MGLPAHFSLPFLLSANNTPERGFATRCIGLSAKFPFTSYSSGDKKNAKGRGRFPLTPYNTRKGRFDGNFRNFCSLFSNTDKNQKCQTTAEISAVTPSTDSGRILPAGQKKAANLFRLTAFAGRRYDDIVRGGSTPCCRPLIAYQQRRAGLSTAARTRRSS